MIVSESEWECRGQNILRDGEVVVVVIDPEMAQKVMLALASAEGDDDEAALVRATGIVRERLLNMVDSGRIYCDPNRAEDDDTEADLEVRHYADLLHFMWLLCDVYIDYVEFDAEPSAALLERIVPGYRGRSFGDHLLPAFFPEKKT